MHAYRIDILQPTYFVIEDLNDLFAAAQSDLLADVATARALGLCAPKYPSKGSWISLCDLLRHR